MSRDRPGKTESAPARTASGTLNFQIKMASDPRFLAVVRSAVETLADVWGFEKDQCSGIALAVDEASSNIIRHAYRNRCDREIELNCQARPDGLEFIFVDRGEPADLSRICAQALDQTAPGGRGTHLIRQIMDEVSYERVPEGNRLRLRKYLAPARRTD